MSAACADVVHALVTEYEWPRMWNIVDRFAVSDEPMISGTW